MHIRYNQKLYLMCIFVFYIMYKHCYNKSNNKVETLSTLKSKNIQQEEKTMKILGMEIPNEVAEAIIAKAKTEELFKEYLKEMKWKFEFLERDKYVCRAIESSRKSYPECKIVFKIMYDADGYFEIGGSGCPDDNGVVTIDIAFDGSCSLSKIHNKLFSHINKTYQIDFAEYFPTLHMEGHIIDIKCKKSQHLNDLLADIKERIPEVTAKCIQEDVIRIQME